MIFMKESVGFFYDNGCENFLHGCKTGNRPVVFLDLLCPSTLAIGK